MIQSMDNKAVNRIDAKSQYIAYKNLASKFTASTTLEKAKARQYECLIAAGMNKAFAYNEVYQPA